MQTIALSHIKGGVGKTTSTLSIGAIYAEQNKRVLLVDLDPQGSLTCSFSESLAPPIQSIYDVVTHSVDISRAVQRTDFKYIDLLPSTDKIEALRSPGVHGLDNPQILRNNLIKIANHYDVALIDCAPSIDALTVSALTAANLLILPTPAEYYSIHSLHKMVELIQRIQRAVNPQLTYRILRTMYNKRSRATRHMDELIEKNFSTRLFSTVIYNDTKIRESQIAGVPIAAYMADSKSNLAYRSLVQEIITLDHSPNR